MLVTKIIRELCAHIAKAGPKAYAEGRTTRMKSGLLVARSRQCPGSEVLHAEGVGSLYIKPLLRCVE